MRGNQSIRYSDAQSFFDLEGSVVMILTPAAAIDVCLTAADHGLVVARIEGGFWDEPSFELRRDCIWDGTDPPISIVDAIRNNKSAALFVNKESELHNAFVLTAPPIEGWPHKRRSY